MSIKKKFRNKEEIAKLLADAWLNISVDESKLYNPLAEIPQEYIDDPHLFILWVMTRPEYFSFICSEILNIEIIPMQAIILREIWNRKFPMLIASRGGSKSFILAVYNLIRLLLLPRRRIVIAGAAFRQSKVIFEYMEAIWNNAPLLRDIVGTGNNSGPKHEVDMWKFHVHGGMAVALPIGDGQKIRGQRAHDLEADEMASIPKEIFEKVMVGFTAVRANPVEAIKIKAAEKLAKELGIWDETDEEKDTLKVDNQMIICGTASYDFDHFGDYWKKWCKIINAKGDTQKLSDLFDKDEDESIEFFKSNNWKNYSVIRIPFELIPEGMMDEEQIARSRITMHTSIYLMEYGACFPTDSNGFYKRSLIENCCISPRNIGLFSHNPDINIFEASLYGNPKFKYVYGIDPASEIDNFSVVILELRPTHTRIVYGWTTTKKQQRKEVAAGLSNEDNFYAYCARKIRNLMKRFPCERMAIDSQGGGVALIEALHDMDKLYEGEEPIWEIIEDDVEKEIDDKPGLHIIEKINFASAEWVVEANQGLKKDMEDKVLLFPHFNPVTLASAVGEDELKERSNNTDTLESCFLEIEELKNELVTIQYTKTPSGRDKWDTPEVKLTGNKKGRQRKDRYSSLLMANASARHIVRGPKDLNYQADGGFAQKMPEVGGPMYVGNEMFSKWAESVY